MGKPAFNRKSMSKYKQGYYAPHNPDKYVGNPSDIQFRSSLEQRFCYFCDFSDRVHRWGSEIVKIPYKGIDGKMHTYYTDYYVEFYNPDVEGGIVYWVIEVKPEAEVTPEPPEPPLNESVRSMRSYKYRLETWIKNQAKWHEAAKYCSSRGWTFRILTERDISKMTSSLR